MKTQTIGLLAEWIFKNKKGDAFKDDSLENIIAGLQQDVSDNRVLYVIDIEGDFIGVMTFTPDHFKKIFFIRNIVIMRHAALVVFMQWFKLNYGRLYKIQGMRQDNHMEYNIDRLTNLMTSTKMKGGN